MAPCGRKGSSIERHHYHIPFGCGVQNRGENLVAVLTIPVITLPGNLGVTHSASHLHLRSLQISPVKDEQVIQKESVFGARAFRPIGIYRRIG